MTDIWVDGDVGSDSASGLTRNTAKKTIAAACGTLVSGDIIKIIQGIYPTVLPPGLLTGKSITIEGEGVVKIVSTGANFLHIEEPTGPSVPTFLKLKNLIVTDFAYMCLFMANGLTGIGATLTFENCTFYTDGPTSGHLVTVVSSGPTPSSILDIHVATQNCTIDNLSSIARFEAEPPGGGWLMAFEHERNNIYNVSTFSSLGAISGATVTVTRLNASHNACPPADITDPTTDVDAMTSPPVYVSSFPVTKDLSLIRGSNPPYLGTGGPGTGDFGNDIGASWWPTTFPESTSLGYIRSAESTTSPSVTFPSNWLAETWKNDIYWYDETLDAPGPEATLAGEIKSSPATLTLLDQKWVIDPGSGAGASARVISPVLDFASKIEFKNLTFWGEERPLLPSGEKEVLDTGTTGPDREIEYRFSNTQFLETALSPAWSTIKRTDSPVTGANRYWQFRVTLRRNATS